MTISEILLQQVVNGLALGMMYALLALGFTMVYGIIELINFAHFSVFMSGTFLGPHGAPPARLHRVVASLTGLPLVGTLLLRLPGHDAAHRHSRRPDRADLPPARSAGCPGTAPMITTIGVAFVLINVVLMIWGPQSKPFPRIIPDRRWAYRSGRGLAGAGLPGDRPGSS